MKRWKTAACVAVSLVCLPLTAGAQDAEKDQLKKELTELKELLTLQKGVIEAQKDLLGAEIDLLQKKFPTLPAGKAGSVAIEQGSGDTLHATRQAYEALESAALQLCKDVKAVAEGREKPVVIITAEDLRLAAQYRVVKGEAEALQEEFTKLLEPKKVGVAGAPAAAVIGMGLSTLIDLTKLFRTDRKLYFAAVSLQEAELADMVAMCLTTADNDTGAALAKVKYARLETESAIAFGQSDLLQRLDQLARDNVALDAKIRETESAIAKAEESKDSAEKLKAADMKRNVAAWKALAARYQTFRSSLAGTDAATRLAIMLAALQGEAVVKMMQPDGGAPGAKTASKPSVKLLTMRVAASGGTTMVTSSTFRSDRMYSTGGVVVTFRLTDGDRVQLAGSIGRDSPLVEVQKVSREAPPKTGRP